MGHIRRERTEIPIQVGGQAVIEGVMMRSPGRVATAVRRNDGSITMKEEINVPFVIRRPSWNIPVVRGFIALVEMMAIGIRPLNFSADIAMEDAEADERRKTGSGETSSGKRRTRSKTGSALGAAATILFAFSIAVLLFFITPLYAATWLFDIEQHALIFNLAAGAIRVTILLGYLYAISRLQDVQRLFQYHGAEHKAVFTHEKGLDLTVENARPQSRFHPRCGTSFILQVALISILCFAVLDWLLILYLGEITLLLRIATHLPLIPLVAGVSYEVLKFTARYSETRFGSAPAAPGLWLQRITTREPDDVHIEVAITALLAAVKPETDDIRSGIKADTAV
jgi:uncharacterized protein YqhQ